MKNIDFSSPYYPYRKVYEGANTYRGIENIPRKIVMYLLDLPDKYGYAPKDDNERPRVRMMKYLYHDGQNPLASALPTPKEKLSLLFDPDNPVLDKDELKAKHPKGYRIYPQEFWGQAQTEAQTTLKIYMGRTRPISFSRAELTVIFEIFSNVNLEGNTKSAAYSRCYAIEQAIIEALHGVNIDGVGAFNFDMTASVENGSRPAYDNGNNVGRVLQMSVTWQDSGENDKTETLYN